MADATGPNMRFWPPSTDRELLEWVAEMLDFGLSMDSLTRKALEAMRDRITAHLQQQPAATTT